MGWTAPRTWVAGEIVTAALMNAHVRDNTRYLKGLDGVPTIESGLTIDNTDGDERLLLPLLSTAECTTVLNAEGEVAFDEQTHRIKYYDNNSVVSVVGTDDVDDSPVDSASTDPISSNWAYDFINTLTAQGSIPYATAARAWTELAKGTAYQHLRMNVGATAPEWATVTGIQVSISTYTGDNTNNRNVTTGFTCKLVIVYGDSVNGTNDILGVCASTSGAATVTGTSSPSLTVLDTALILNASDGFDVDMSDYNQSGKTYYYCAIG